MTKSTETPSKAPNQTTPPSRSLWQICTHTISFIAILGLGFWINHTQSTLSLYTKNIEKAQKALQIQQENLRLLEKKLENEIHNTPTNNPITFDDWAQLRVNLELSYYALVFNHSKADAKNWLEIAITLAEKSIHTTSSKQLVDNLHITIQKIDQLILPNKKETLGLLQELHNQIRLAIRAQTDTPQNKISTTDTKPTWLDWFSTQYWHEQIRHYLDDLWDSIHNSIQVTPLNPQEQSLFSPRGLSELSFSITSLIEQAQWGVVYQDQAVFQLALTQLAKTIHIKLSNSPEKDHLIENIKKLLTQSTIEVHYPNYKPLIDATNKQIEKNTPQKSAPTTSDTQKKPTHNPLTVA